MRSCASAACAALRAREKRPASNCASASSSAAYRARSFCCRRHCRACRGSENSAARPRSASVQEDEGRQQQQQHQVERQVHPPRRPEHRDRALVVAGEQRHRGRDAEQGQKPECRAHTVALLLASGRRRGQRGQRVVDARRFAGLDLRLQLLQQRGRGLGRGARPGRNSG